MSPEWENFPVCGFSSQTMYQMCALKKKRGCSPFLNSSHQPQLQDIFILEPFRKVLHKHTHSPDMSSEENWMILNSWLRSAAQKICGQGKSKQKVCFEENVKLLMPLIEEKNDAHKSFWHPTQWKWGKSSGSRNRRWRGAVDQTKEYWIRSPSSSGRRNIGEGWELEMGLSA